MNLNEAKSIWTNKNEEVKRLIINSLVDETVFKVPYNQKVYFFLWKQLIKDRVGIDCNPYDYLRSFSYKTFSDYWKAIKEEK